MLCNGRKLDRKGRIWIQSPESNGQSSLVSSTSQRFRKVTRTIAEFQLLFFKLGIIDLEAHLPIAAIAVLVGGRISD